MKKWLFLIITSLLLVACSNEEAVTDDGKPIIKIGYLPTTHAAPLYFMDDVEHYDVELVRFSSWIDLMDALNAGRIDGASVLIELAMKAREKGIDLQAVALGHEDGNVITVAPHIESVDDLVGESIAIPNRYSTHHVYVHQMLEQAGYSIDDVNLVEMAPAEMPSSLSENRVAAYVVAEPFGSIGVSLGVGKVLFQSQDIWPNSIDCALVMRSDFLARDEAISQHFVSNYAKAGMLAEHKDEATLAHINSFLNIQDEVLMQSLEWISYEDLIIREDAFAVLREAMIDLDLSTNPPLYEEFVNNSYLQEVTQ